jgi:hypothetical protein
MPLEGEGWVGGKINYCVCISVVCYESVDRCTEKSLICIKHFR